MWQAFLQDNYGSREAWLAYAETYGLAERLGYTDANKAWDDNPFIQGSTNPADFSIATEVRYEDGEVLGVDKDGGLLQWNAKTGEPYNCGETLEQFGANNLSATEHTRVLRDLSKG